MSYGIGGTYVSNIGELATVAEISPNGIIISLPDGEKGIIPLNHLDQYDVDITAFRLGESFGVFRATNRRKGGKRETQMLKGLPVFYLKYKSNKGNIYVSSKLDRIKEGINVAFEHFTEAEKRIYLLRFLEDLLWDDLDALFQLDDYCLNRRNRADDHVTRILIANYILNEDGTLPRSTNEAMYEMRTGHRPFWLKKKKDLKKTINFAEYLKNKK